MSRHLRRLAALLMALLITTSTCFAGANIVSPVTNTIMYGDSILVSVKLSDKQKVKITVYREMEEATPAVYETTIAAIEVNTAAPAEPEKKENQPAAEASNQESANSPQNNAAQTPADSAPEQEPQVPVTTTSPAVTTILVKEATYRYIDSSAYTADDIKKIEAGVKTAEDGTEILLSTGKSIPNCVDKIFADTVEYSNETGISFYTKQLSSVNPGLYKVSVELVGENNEPSTYVNSYVAVKEKKVEQKTNIFVEKKTGTLSYLQNFLKSLFR